MTMLRSHADERLFVYVAEFQASLRNWAITGDLEAAARAALGFSAPLSALDGVIGRLAGADFHDVPSVEVIDGARMGHAMGAYAAETGTIYLNRDWLAVADEASVLRVLTEEFGHYLDARLNATDRAGDEGEAFAAFLTGGAVSADDLARMGAEDDGLTIWLGDGWVVVAEAANITGGEGSDRLTGTSGNDTINGRGGNDNINGLDGDDRLISGDGRDTVFGGSGNDYLDISAIGLLDEEIGDGRYALGYGGDGNDEIVSVGGFAEFYGGDGSDRIVVQNIATGVIINDNEALTQKNSYEIYSGSGNDEVVVIDVLTGGGVGAETRTISGGEGFDTLYVPYLRNDFMNVSHPVLSSQISGFERLIVGNGGSQDPVILGDYRIDFGDTLFIDGAALDRSTGYINGYLYALDASALVQCKLDISVRFGLVIGGQRDDTIRTYYINEQFTPGGSLGVDLFGEGGNDRIWGGSASDRLAGGIGADWLYGQGGSDVASGNAGNDFIDGGDGIDTAIFSGNQADYIITELTYNTFTVQDTRGIDGTDTIIDINILRFADGDLPVIIRGLSITGDGTAEELNGGAFSDLLDGAGGNDELNGNGGNDNALGGAGNDTVNGQAGNDILQGGDGSDTLLGADGNDSVDGGAGNDILIGGDGRGNDTYRGGDGIDTVVYKSAVKSIVTVDLTKGTGSGAEVGNDRLSGIENVVGGSKGDKLTGNNAGNILTGREGNDRMTGLAGSDVLSGDAGRDVMNGGKGADRIDGGTDNDTATGGSGWDVFIFDRGDGRDTITDLDGRTDRIEIGRGANDFDDIGLRKSGDNVIVTFDDVRITLVDVRMSEITAADFLFV